MAEIVIAEVLVVATLVMFRCCIKLAARQETGEEKPSCEGCWWNAHCENADGLKLCAAGTNGREDAPWERF